MWNPNLENNNKIIVTKKVCLTFSDMNETLILNKAIIYILGLECHIIKICR